MEGRTRAELTVSAVAVLVLAVQIGVVRTSYKTILDKFDVEPLSDQDEEDSVSTPEQNGMLECLYPSDCREIQRCDHTKSGVYRVFPFGVGKGFLVYCDMVTKGGGWLVFQRRQDGSVDFYRKWKDYKDGFGNLYGEFWLGLDKIHLLTSQQNTKLLVHLGSYDNGTGHALYSRFRISGEDEMYRLLLGKYSGNIGDSLTYHNGFKFSTFDVQNDYHSSKNCALAYHGAWWYKSCHYSNLNGRYLHVNRKEERESSAATWYHWSSDFKPLQFTDMMIRPVETGN